jgi:signal transduction histidine kinase
MPPRRGLPSRPPTRCRREPPVPPRAGSYGCRCLIIADTPWLDETRYFVVSNAALIMVVGLMLYFWILRPIRRIHASLAGRDVGKLAPLLKQKDEFGDLARMVQISLNDREQLQRSVDYRAQLGRDLHDGAVQGIFAAGMTLSRVQSLVTKDPPAAQQLLNETRDALNRIILELRGHIEEIKPNLQDIPFGEAVEQVIKQLQGPTPARVMLDLDDDLIARQSAHFLNQTLQFVREAVSNAMRHGQPSQLTVAWQRTPDGSRLTVFDNGVGFDLQTPKPGGHGLNNLSERALALGGRLEINTVPGWGTQIGLILPPTAP